ncbi:hypothetical protein [Xanthomonas phaseoli]|uniref:hypothetical protein n=1 Tax=Xanthomonas phaseoli TaxID=1985254 RepID=UPI0002FB516D|nr:hypothetical protein [Xanthomonas phaseoli]
MPYRNRDGSEDTTRKPRWTKLGVAYAHADGQGVTVRVDGWPAGSSELVLREPKPDEEADA